MDNISAALHFKGPIVLRGIIGVRDTVRKELQS